MFLEKGGCYSVGSANRDLTAFDVIILTITRNNFDCIYI